MNVLIAGIGNIFLGDDAFGVEVAQRLSARNLPPGVRVHDFGLRGIDLGYALMDGIDAAILVDAVQRGGPPGSVYLIEPEPAAADEATAAAPFSAHGMDPAEVLRWVRSIAGPSRRIVLVGCEPESFGTENEGVGRMSLSAAVAAAVPDALALIEAMVARMVEKEGDTHAA